MPKIKHPVIILEGPDGSGKTTLAKAIGGHYLHAGYIDTAKGNMVEYHLNLLKAAVILSDFEPVVIDRWRMSEVVYGTVFRGAVEGNLFTGILYQLADLIGVTFVNCQPADEQLYLDTFNELKTRRVEMYKNLNLVYRHYALAIQDLSLVQRPIIYDRFTDDPKEFSFGVLSAQSMKLKLGCSADNPVKKIDAIFKGVMLSKTGLQ